MSIQTDHETILSIYETTRAAHFERDATKFLSAYGHSWTVVVDGEIQQRRKEDTLPALEQYLKSMDFIEVTDQVPPTVEISDDGTLATLIANVKVRGHHHQDDGTTEPVAFSAAWVDVFKKQDGDWILIARANTQRSESDSAMP